MKKVNAKRVALTALSGLLLVGCGKTNAKTNVESIATETTEIDTESIVSTETKQIVEEPKNEFTNEEINFANLIEYIDMSYCDDLTKSILKEIAYNTESDEMPYSISWVLAAEEYDRVWYMGNLLKEACQEQKSSDELTPDNIKTFNTIEDELSTTYFVNHCATYGNYKFYEMISDDPNLYLVTDENNNVLLNIDLENLDNKKSGQLNEFSDFLNTNKLPVKDNYTIEEIEELNNLFNNQENKTL